MLWVQSGTTVDNWLELRVGWSWSFQSHALLPRLLLTIVREFVRVVLCLLLVACVVTSRAVSRGGGEAEERESGY